MKTAAPLPSAVSLMCVVVVSACTDVKSPVAPPFVREDSPPRSAPSPVAASAEAPAFPPVSGPARVFVADYQPVYSMHGSPLASRYVLDEDRTFALQYASANYPFFEYRGTYKETDGVITFEWEGCCGWGATGLLRGDSLTVEYSERMQHSDFLNGVYTRAK